MYDNSQNQILDRMDIVFQPENAVLTSASAIVDIEDDEIGSKLTQ